MTREKTIGGLWRTNCFGSNPSGSGVVCETACRINHSCEPNAMRNLVDREDDLEAILGFARQFAALTGHPVPDARVGDFFVFAKDIPAGTEITVDYLGEEEQSLSPAARRDFLRLKYNFEA